MSYKFSQNVHYKYFYHMTGIVLWTLGYYRFHSYLDSYLDNVFYIFSYLPVHWYLFSMFETGSGASSTILGNIFIFNWTIDVKPCNFRLPTWGKLKLWQDSIQSRTMTTLKWLICVSSNKWSFRLHWKHQACKREPPLTGFFSCSVIVI